MMIAEVALALIGLLSFYVVFLYLRISALDKIVFELCDIISEKVIGIPKVEFNDDKKKKRNG